MIRDERLIRKDQDRLDRVMNPDDGSVPNEIVALLPCDSKWEYPRNQLVLGIIYYKQLLHSFFSSPRAKTIHFFVSLLSYIL